MTDEVVKGGDIVKKGDVLMVLDSTDIDLSIEKTVAQIAQLEAQIQSKKGTPRRIRMKPKAVGPLTNSAQPLPRQKRH